VLALAYPVVASMHTTSAAERRLTIGVNPLGSRRTLESSLPICADPATYDEYSAGIVLQKEPKFFFRHTARAATY
jgi:hypothetical protein